MDLNDPVMMAELLVEREAEAARIEEARKFVGQFTIGLITVEELASKLTEIVERTS